MKKIIEWIKKNFTFNAFKVFVNLIKISLKRWFNQVLYLVLAIGIFIDWFGKADSQGGITVFALIIFSYILITTDCMLKIKEKDGNTTN